MEFYDVIKKRRSIRNFNRTPVEPEKLRRIMEAVQVAPSANHVQPWKFIVVTDPNQIKRVTGAARGQTFVGEAPVIIAAVGFPKDKMSSNGNVAHMVDLGIAGEHLALAVAAEGLATCWIAALDQEEMCNVLNIPSNARVVAVFPVGYSSVEPYPKSRKTLAQITALNTWDGQPPDWAK